MPKMIGSIGCFATAPAKIGRKRFSFDSTTKGLTLSALAHGAKAGTIIQADFGAGFRKYVIEAAPHDNRCGGYWAVQA